MSGFEVKKITCPHCSRQQNVKIYPSVNVTHNPELKENLLSKELFMRTCKYCSRPFELRHAVLYNDMDNKYIIYYIPRSINSKIIDSALENEYKSLEGIRKRIVSDFETLKEKILIFDSGLDDMAAEITKLAVREAVKDKINGNIRRISFSFCHFEKNTMGFEFETDNEPYCRSTRLEVYQKAEYVVKKTAGTDKKMTGFLNINEEWADNMLYRFRLRQKKREQYLNQVKNVGSSEPMRFSLDIKKQQAN